MRTIIGLLVVCVAIAAGSKLEVREFMNSHIKIKNDKVFMTKRVTEKDQNPDKISFFAIGDWGGLPVFPFRTVIETTVANEMTRLAKLYNTAFQLALGDNFYFNGVKDADDKRFKETYDDVFDSEQLKDTPWYFVLGNHDHYGNASAQLEYAKRSNRWVLPAFNYSIDIALPTKQDLIKIVMIDTVLMCGNSGYDWDYDQPKFSSLRDQIKSNDYFDALDKELRDIYNGPYVPYVLVAGHFPVWSVAEHGPTACLVNKLRPLLHKYKVSAYLCGHDHNIAHISDTFMDSRVEYVVTGAAGYIQNTTDHLNAVPPNSLKFFWGGKGKNGLVNGAFALFEASPLNLTMTFFESDGKSLYNTVIQPRPKV